MKKINQSGRSLLEIIAVMGLIGILTLGSVKAFQEGMNTIRAKYIMEQIQLRVDEAISITELSQGHKKMVYTPEYVNKTGEGAYGYAFTTKDISMDKTSLAYYLASNTLKSTRKVQIELTGNISPNVCGKLRERIVISSDFTEAKADENDILGAGCPTSTISKMTFTVTRKPEA